MPTLTEVKTYLSAHGIEVLEFDQPTPTAELAARAVGCSSAQIAKTVLLLVGGAPVAVVTSGDMKVKSSRLKQATGRSGKVRLPQAQEVLEISGYAPGGVSPFLLPPSVPVLLDSSLRRFPLVYPAAGNDTSGVPISFVQLQELTGGEEVGVCDPLASGEEEC